MRRAGKILWASMALACGAFGSQLSAETAPSFPNDAELRTAYALPASHVETLAGEPVHYVDEGQGPALLLLHGSFASLRQWDDWAAVLSKQYRVIRYDKSPAGLSGPNPQGNYTTDQQIAVIDALMDKLGIGRFAIIGTSSAGVPAAAYAAARPERIKGVVLANIASGPINMDYSTLPKSLLDAVAADQAHPGWHSEEYWRQILLANIEDKARVTPGLVARWTGLNHRMMRDPQTAKQVVAASDLGRTPSDLARITAPTFLLWSEHDHETSLEAHGLKAFGELGTADKTLSVISGCGHMMPLDCPIRSVERILPFLARVSKE